MTRARLLLAAAVMAALGTAFAASARAQDQGEGEAAYESDIVGADAGFDESEVDPYSDTGYVDDSGGTDDSGIDESAGWSDGEGDVVIEGAAEDEAAAAGTGGGPAASAAVLAGDALLDWAKALPVNRLDARLPAMPLDLWLRSHFAASYPPMWSVGDCGEQSGDAVIDAGRDIPACAMADGLDARGKGYEIVILGEDASGDVLYNAAVLHGYAASVAGEDPVEPVTLLGDLPHALAE